MDCHNYTVTTRPFWVKDPPAFEAEMKRLGIWLVHGSYDASVRKDGDEAYRLDGYDVDFSLYDGTRDEEISLLTVIQKHLAEDSVLVIHQVAHEGLRGVSGGVIAVTPDRIEVVTLEDLEAQLLAGPLTDEAIHRLAVSTVDGCGDVFYDPTEFGEPWGDPEERDVEGATQRLLDWVTDNVEAGIRKALRFYRETRHTVALVIAFDNEAGVLVNDQVVYVVPADSRGAMLATQVATALAKALGVEVLELDVRFEMRALIEAGRCDEASWENVPSMVAAKLGG